MALPCSPSVPPGVSIEDAEEEDQAKSNGVEITRNKTTAPPDARAKRAATGSTCSARIEPSRGTRILFNMLFLLETTVSRLSASTFSEERRAVWEAGRAPVAPDP